MGPELVEVVAPKSVGNPTEKFMVVSSTTYDMFVNGEMDFFSVWFCFIDQKNAEDFARELNFELLKEFIQAGEGPSAGLSVGF